MAVVSDIGIFTDKTYNSMHAEEFFVFMFLFAGKM
jgi:hypothetical protein